MLQLLQGFWASRAVYAAAKLGIADLLKDGPKSSDDLAALTGTHPPSLYRLMRALSSIEVFSEDDQKCFALTPLGSTLRSDVPGSLRYVAIEEMGENHYPAWEKLLHSLKTGAIAFDHVYGKSKWQYMGEHPEEARIFDQAMASFSGIIAAAVTEAYDFSSSGVVADIGGGNGSLLAAVLKSAPQTRGILFDVPHVSETARPRLASEGLADRCEVVGGDFFKSVPRADLYTLRWIIHDWNDEQSAAILRNCRDAMTPGGKVLLIEAVVQPGPATAFSKFMDLNMLVMTGGRERTAGEYRDLFHAAGLKMTRIIPTHTEMSVIEAVSL